MLSTVKHKQTKQKKNNWHINPWTYKGWGGGVGVDEGFSEFSPRGSPDVFSSCSFISSAHFESSSVMVSFHGYEILRHKKEVVKPF